MAVMSGSFLDILRVRAARRQRHRGFLSCDGWSVPCALGEAGLRLRKREGDLATPVGIWPMRAVLFRPDRVPPPRTGLPVFRISPGDGWCDDPADRNYNRPVRLPYAASAESLWRADRLYDIVVVLGHNDSPPLPGRGSAVFFHLATPDYGPTAGCVAVSRRDMTTLLARCDAGTRLAVA